MEICGSSWRWRGTSNCYFNVMQWDKLDDKLAVSGLGFAALIVLWASTGLIGVSDMHLKPFSLSVWYVLHGLPNEHIK